MSPRAASPVLALAVVLASLGCAPGRRGAGTGAPDAGSAREADRLYAEGVAAAQAGAFARAVARFRGSLAADPGRIETRYNLGLALLETGELLEATSLLSEVSLARPRHAESRYALGSALRKRGLHDRAVEEFQAALRADGRHAKAQYGLARTLDDLNRADDARAAWQRFLDRFPNDPRAAEARTRLAQHPRAPGGAGAP